MCCGDKDPRDAVTPYDNSLRSVSVTTGFDFPLLNSVFKRRGFGKGMLGHIFNSAPL